MKLIRPLTATIMAVAFVASPFVGFAAEGKTDKPKPYPLDKCIVSDEKLGADPNMKEYVFTHEGREIKLCCKSCLKDFNKNTAKYIKKIEKAEKAKK